MLLFAINLFAYPALWSLLLLRLRDHPAAVLADLRDHRRAARPLTIVAGTCLLSDQVSLFRTAASTAAGC
jgi:hypothetical protein